MFEAKSAARTASGPVAGTSKSAREPEKALCAMLLSSLDESLSIERAAMRQAGVLRVRSVGSGARALAIIARQLSGELGGRVAAQTSARQTGASAGFTPAAPGAAFAVSDVPIDLIICTESMSDMRLPAFLRELGVLCRNNRWRFPPVLAVTGEADAEAALLALGAGAVLLRPYAVSALGESIRKLLSDPEREPGLLLSEASIAERISFRKSLPGQGGGDFFARRQREASRKLCESSNGNPADNRSKDFRPEALTELPASGLTRACPAVPGAVKEEPVPVRAAFAHTASGPTSAGPDAMGGAPGDATGIKEYAASLNPLLLTKKGMALLRAGKPAEAEHLLRMALAYDSLDLEAGFGLARLCAQSGDRRGESRWLNRALIICLETGQKERADEIKARLPHGHEPDPYLLEARHLLCEEDYEAAAEAFLQAGLRNKTPLHELVGRAGQFTGNPESAISGLCEAFAASGHKVTATNLRHRLLADSETEFVPSGLLARFPKLCEAVAVARYTARIWRQAAAS